MNTVRTIRIEENTWNEIKKLSKEENKTITAILNEALEKYISEKTRKKAVRSLENIPELSLGGKAFSREEAYEDRY